MPGLIRSLSNASRLIPRSYGVGALPAVESIVGSLDAIDSDEFRERAFSPEEPILITTKNGRASKSANGMPPSRSLPAAHKWFSYELRDAQNEWEPTLSLQYLSRFGDTILPYELIVDSNDEHLRRYINWAQAGVGSQDVASFLAQLLSQSNDRIFHRFNAPLSLFLEACRSTPPSIIPPRLYIAQAQIIDLPKQLRDDLPTPRVIKEAGNGDIYDSNIWMGIPPTYTPLHKDPNPNLFVQLASSKRVRLFRPSTGSAMFQDVQQRIGRFGSVSFRGDEMMEGPERDALDEAVWGNNVRGEGLEAIIRSGDALFIPKGWWHSIRSVGNDVTASVNWWFR